MVRRWLRMEIRSGPWGRLVQRSQVAMDQQLSPRSNGYDHRGRPWTYMGCPDKGLQVFMKTSIGRRGRHICGLFRKRTSPPAAGNGNTKRKHFWTSISQLVRFRVHGLFLTCILFLPGLRCPSIRGCPQCGPLINHKDS